MSVFIEIIYLAICSGLFKKLEDSLLKVILVPTLSIPAFYFASIYFGLVCIGFCIMFGLGKPKMNEIYNTSGLRRKLGGMFDLLGMLLVIIGIVAWFFLG
ncbi:MAG: hypothetical protein WCS30_04420 [Selenomonadaceae bacterium]